MSCQTTRPTSLIRDIRDRESGGNQSSGTSYPSILDTTLIGELDATHRTSRAHHATRDRARSSPEVCHMSRSTACPPVSCVLFDGRQVMGTEPTPLTLRVTGSDPCIESRKVTRYWLTKSAAIPSKLSNGAESETTCM